MKVLIVGNGGREHTLLWKMAKDDPDCEFFMTLGNGGTGDMAKHVPISPVDTDALAGFAEEESIDLTVVGPEVPLSLGIVDTFESRRLRTFGPTKDAAMLETRKAFATEIMRRHGAPTAEFAVFRDHDAA